MRSCSGDTMTSGGRFRLAARLGNNQQIGPCEERGWHSFGMMGDRSEYQGVNQVIQRELWNITYKIFYLHIICLLLFGSKKQQTNKPSAKSSDGEKFPYCLQNWLSDEKRVKATYTGWNHQKSSKNTQREQMQLLLCSWKRDTCKHRFLTSQRDLVTAPYCCPCIFFWTWCNLCKSFG